MKIFPLYYSLMISLFISISCSNKDNPTPSTLASDGHISASIQSSIYGDTATCLLFQAGDSIRITSSAHYPKRIALIIDGTNTGTYICSSNTSSSITYYDENGIKYISTGTNPESKITITKVDLANALVSGTFTATLTKENGSENISMSVASFTNLTCHTQP